MVPARPLRAALSALALSGAAVAPALAATEPQALVLFNRPVADLRATLGGLGPAPDLDDHRHPRNIRQRLIRQAR